MTGVQTCALPIYTNFYDKSLGSAWTSFPNAIATVGTMFFVVFGLLRLARFAGKDYKRKVFLGLPTPAAAMLVISLSLLWGNVDLNPFSMGREEYFVIGIITTVAFLMISDIPYPKIQGTWAMAVGISLLPGILPLLVYQLVPDSELPVIEIFMVFFGLVLLYVIGGPFRELYSIDKRKKN